MNRILLIAVLFCTANFYGQGNVATHVKALVAQKTVFEKVAPFTVSNSVNKGNSQKAVENATYAVLNRDVSAKIAATRPAFIEVAVPYNGSVINLQLYKVNVLAEGFHAETSKGESIAYDGGAYYRGIVKGDSKSVASFNFFRQEVSGIISAQGINNLVVGRLQTQGNFSDYIIYSDASLTKANNFTCAVPDPVEVAPQNFGKLKSTLSTHCVTVYFELDYAIFEANNHSTELANNWLTGIFNNVQTLYDNDGITTAIKSVYVWTEQDPYSGEGSSDYLYQFYAARPYFDGDVAQLLGIDEGGLGGVAINVAGLCSDYNVSYSDVDFEYQDVPTFSWNVQVITHELGHLYGSPHTHGCYWNGNNTSIDGCGTSAGYVEGDCTQGPIPYDTKGTIMSYCHLVQGVGINFANGFGPQPAARILQHIESSSCLSTDCVNTCINSVTAFDVSQTTQNAITVSWTDAGNATSWQIGFTTLNGTVSNWQTVTTPTFTFDGLTANTYYKFAVRPDCSNATGEAQQIVVATAADWCGGATFADTAPNGNYPNNQHLIRTIKPENPANEALFINFSSFATEQDYDFLYVYDGPNTSAPRIGAYSGGTVPGPFSSTAEDGSITFEFISDGYIGDAGWSASVSCLLSTEASAYTSLQYYPNPTTGVVTLTSPDGITGVTVYNVAGQLLLNQKTTGTQSAVNLDGFASGVYFFKVTNGTRTSTVRIIKE